ncbi:MAG: hypothetical protein JOZ29_15150 [Deltaproteobacteria bacterium]|nr:hypothetical protein [Deltaproteobacteria bacterium]
MAKAPAKVLDPVARGSLYPAAQPESTEGIVRIDLDVVGSGEISGAISLVRTICPALYMGTYSSEDIAGRIVYVRVAASGAQRAADALRRYGFKVVAIRQESDTPNKSVFSARN